MDTEFRHWEEWKEEFKADFPGEEDNDCDFYKKTGAQFEDDKPFFRVE